MSNENANLTKVIVPCRFSYLHCWEPNAVSDGDPKYSVSAIIPKSDTETIEKIKKAIEQAKKDSVSKWGGKVPANLKLPLRDGDIDRPEDEAYSTLPETYDVLMTGAKANLVVTDPPYNVDYEGSAGKIKNDHMENEQFYNFLFAAFVNMEQHMESDASIYVFHADTEGLNFRKAFQAAGFYLSGCCIWKKQSLVLGRSPYQWQHEPCLFGWKKGGKHNWYSDRKQTTIWEFDRPKKSESHPTSKPVGLVAPCRIRFPSSLPMRLLEIMRRSWLGLPPLMKISLHPSSNAM